MSPSSDDFKFHHDLAVELNQRLTQRRFWVWIKIETAGVGPEQAEQVAKAIAPQIDQWLASLGSPSEHRQAAANGPTLTDTGVDVKVDAIGKGEAAPDDPVVGNPERAFAYFVK